MKYKNPSMQASKDMTCIKKRDGRTDNPKAICPQLFQSWGHNDTIINIENTILDMRKRTHFESIYCFCDLDLGHE